MGIIHAERFKVTKLNESNKEGRYRQRRGPRADSGASNTKVGGTRRMQRSD